MPIGWHFASAGPTNKYMVSGTIGPSICSSSYGASWNPSNSTCTVSPTTEWDVAFGTILLDPGMTSTNPRVTLSNQGTLMNNGTFTQNGDFDNHGNVTSQNLWEENRSGALQNHLLFTDYGAFIENGTFNNSGSGDLIFVTPYHMLGDNTKNSIFVIGVDGAFTDSGSLQIMPSGNLTLDGGNLTLNSGGTLFNNGTIIDAGVLHIMSGSGLNNHKLIEIRKNPNVTLKRGIINDGSLWNWYNGIINNEVSLVNNVGATLYNYNKIYNYANITNSGSIINECGGQVIAESGSIYTGTQPTQFCLNSTPTLQPIGSLFVSGFAITALLVSRKLRKSSSSRFFQTDALI